MEMTISDIRRRTADGLSVGDTFIIRRTFTRRDVREFGRITRDHNPIHGDRRFIALKGFTSPICHGLLVASMITEIGGQMGWLASGMSFRFKQPVYFDDTITCRCELTAVDDQNRAEAEAVFTNQHGDVVLAATLYGILPNTQERSVLRDLLDPC